MNITQNLRNLSGSGIRLSLLSAAMAVGFMLSPESASASYMSNCNALIGQWNQCQQAGGNCSPIEARITAECKCHRKINNEWKLVTAAVGKDGVCNPTIPYDDVPPPGDPRDPHGNTGKGSPDTQGNFDRTRGGPDEGNMGRGNPR